MSRTLGAHEAKTHLPRLLDEVARGETITITRHGTPVARLMPPEHAEPPDVAAAIAALREFSSHEQISLGESTLRDLIEEGRRF